MNLAIAHNPQSDPFAAWQASNGAAWCRRLSATISHATCKANQHNSNHKFGDFRCQGCGGLDNQKERPALALVWDTVTGRSSSTARDDQIEDLDALDETIDGHYENSDLDDDLDDEQLLALFPELARDEDDDSSPGFQRFSEYQEAAPRYAVYRGRCKKCGGFVENTRERQDDNVFRCLACGWRTGVEYENNRTIHGVTP